MTRPTTTDIKSWSKVQFGELDEPFTNSELDVVVDRACDYIEQVTGRTLDSSMPAGLVTTAEEAAQMRVEQVAYQAQPDYIETGADDEIASFTAGSYSENRKGEVRLTRGGSLGGLPPVNPWSALNDRLWLLMTDDMRDFWREQFMGIRAPYFETTEVDWSGMGNQGQFDVVRDNISLWGG